MTAYEIRRINVGQVNAYLVKTEEHLFLIDTGMKGTKNFAQIEAACEGLGRSVGEVDLILLTHTHYDHAGGAAECKARSGASVLVHRAEADVLRAGSSTFPGGANGFGRFMVGIVKKLQKSGSKFPPLEPDIEIEGDLQGGMDLHNYGFPGIAVPTPSYSPGSLALLTDGGDCFCGDILFNIFPGSVFPPFADDPAALPSKWKLLLDLGAELFHPGHGGPIERQRVERELQRRS